ncbi:MAG: glycosyltransferase family 2 protein [Nitrososphaerota archaeon]
MVKTNLGSYNRTKIRNNCLNSSGSEVVALVVNYNSGTKIVECLKMLLSQSYKPAKIIAIDNASTDGSRELILKEFGSNRRVILLFNDRNLGYAKAVKIAALKYPAKFYFLVNPDVILPNDYILSLIDVIKSKPFCKILSGVILSEDGRIILSMGAFFDPITGYDWHTGWKREYKSLSKELIKADYIPLTAALVSGDILMDIDERYFLYNEDLDLGILVNGKQYDCYVYTGVAANHLVKLRSRSLRKTRIYHHVKGRLYLLYKYEPMPFLLTSTFCWLILLPLILVLVDYGLALTCIKAIADFIKELSNFTVVRKERVHLFALKMKPISALKAIMRHIAIGGHLW